MTCNILPPPENNGRDIILDIAKGVSMILIVVGHSCCPNVLNRFIYWFHVPLFFFVSGWFLKDRYVASPKRLFISRFKGIYLPMIKWTTVFILLHNIFAFFHFNSSEITFSEMGEEFFKTITLRSSGESLVGTYWFLISLIFCTFYSELWLRTLRRFGRISSLWIGFGILLAMSLALLSDSLLSFIPVLWGKVSFQATAFFLTGFAMGKLYREGAYCLRYYQILLFLIPAVLAFLIPGHEMMSNTGVQSLYYYLVALCGILATLSLSKYLSETRAASLLSYIGARTFYILTFQFLCLKCVFAIYVRMNGMDLDAIANLEYRHFDDSLLWIPATIVGVGGPLLIYRFFHWRPRFLFHTR